MHSNLISPSNSWSGPTPDDDNDWDSADGGVSNSQRKKKQAQKGIVSPGRSATRDVQAWLSDTDPSLSIPKTVTPVRRGTPFKSLNAMSGSRAKQTPTTVESTDSQSDAIPLSYVNTIIYAFGPTADLYEDVLDISRTASLRDTRIAYFRRGRQVLAEHQDKRRDAAASVGGSVSDGAKLKFQAVSMAYEILTNPVWKATYDACGLDTENVSVDVIHVTKVDTRTPLLRRSASLDARRKRTSNAVRWNEEVEELVFSQDPSELGSRSESLDDDDTPTGSFNQRGRKKKKERRKRTVIETEELKTHLENLDRDAGRHFVSDFLDDLESSIEGLLSLGSRNLPDDEDTEQECNPNEIGKTKESETVSDIDDVKLDETPVHDRPLVIGNLFPHARRKSQRSTNSGRNSTDTEIKPFDMNAELKPRQLCYDDPEIFLANGTACKQSYDGNTVGTSDSVSTLSASIVDKKFAMNTSRDALRSTLAKLPEDDDALNTTSDAVICDQSSATSTRDRSIILKQPDKHGVTHVDHRTGCDAVTCDEFDPVDSWCGADDLEEVKSLSVASMHKDAAQWTFSDDSTIPTVSVISRGHPDDSSSTQKADGAQPDFYIHLMTYLNSLTVDLSGLMEIITLSEDDLDGMLKILRTELEQIPDDFDPLEEFEELL